MKFQLQHRLFLLTTFAVIVASVLSVTPGICAVMIVNGVVKDDKGTPLGGATVQVCGLQVVHNGVWKREFRSGLMPKYETDQNGRFQLPFNDPNMRFDAYFDREGFAPVFLYAISNSAPDLNVTMTRGQTLSGTVSRLVSGKLEPGSGVVVELRIPSADLWYQRRTKTDAKGKYSFQVNAPAAGKKCQVACNNKVVPVELKQGDAVAGPDFEIGNK